MPLDVVKLSYDAAVVVILQETSIYEQTINLGRQLTGAAHCICRTVRLEVSFRNAACVT